MRTRLLQLVFVGMYLQVPTCHPSCTLEGLRAHCNGQNHHWVPVLPPNITHLFLEKNSIQEINGSLLRAFRELQLLDLAHQSVTLTIRNNAFLRQRALTQLNLGDNLTLKLEPRAFAGLFNLRNLLLFHCRLSDSILSDGYLAPLLSLETLNLYGNHIVRLRPGEFFSRLTKFSELNLELNHISQLCEEDLASFSGKSFSYLTLKSNHFRTSSNWEDCGNPFKGMSFSVLDLSLNGLNTNKTRQLFKVIEGTPVAHLIYSYNLGKGFSYTHFLDPDQNTFEGLKSSRVRDLDLSINDIFALQRAVFSHLKDATTIDVSRNKINRINRNAFDGLQDNLRVLNLSSNLLGEIYSYTFTNLTELQVLILSYNHIGALGHSAFSGLPRLRALYLTGNSLKNLAFTEALPNLELLLLDHNNIDSLYKIDHFGGTSSLVDISNNKLTNLEDVYVILTDFKRLTKLFFSGNSIKWCTLNGDVTIPQNNSLLVLDLHDSYLEKIWKERKCLDLFDHLNNLLWLDLSFNSLSTLPKGIFRGLTVIETIYLSSNALTYLETDVFPASLSRLYLSKNFLASPDPATFQSLVFLDLSENRFHCDCNLENFLKWLNSSVTFLRPAEEYRCEFPAAVHNLTLLNYFAIIDCEEDDEQSVRGLKLALFIVSAVLTMSIVLSGVVYTRFRGHVFIIYKKMVGRVLEGPKPTPPANDMQYDAFICFSDNDYRWVEAALLKKLDSQFAEENIFRCCFEARDFLPGEDHLSNIRDAVWTSRKTLCIVSNEFLKDGWCLEAFTLAQGRMLEELTNSLIMLAVGKVAHYQLLRCNAIRAFVRRREYLTWPEDPQDLDWFYEQLVSRMLKDTKVKKFEENQPQPEQPEGEPEEPEVGVEEPEGEPEEPEVGVEEPEGEPEEPEVGVEEPEGEPEEPEAGLEEPEGEPKEPEVGAEEPEGEPEEPEVGAEEPEGEPKEPEVGAEEPEGEPEEPEVGVEEPEGEPEEPEAEPEAEPDVDPDLEPDVEPDPADGLQLRNLHPIAL